MKSMKFEPITKLDQSTNENVALIRLKELPTGFRVVSAEAVVIESLNKEEIQVTRATIVSNQTNEPEEIYCLMINHLDSIEPSSSQSSVGAVGFGKYSNLAVIQERAQEEASYLHDNKGAVINMINKEISS
jgi:hypothetical protein